MSYTEQDVVAMVTEVTSERLTAWVSQGLIRPRTHGGQVVYAEVDVARTRLLCQLSDELEITEEAIPVVLSLLDQVHGLRRELRAMTRAIERQPEEVRQQLAEAYRALADEAED
ncbi:MAG: chaperone modulator CbpM [Maricaulaceae bacterium]